MANNLTISNTINGSIDGLGFSANANANLVPLGNAFYAEGITVSTGSYTLITTGSNFGTISTIYAENTSATGSISLVLSASGVANNLGIIPPIGSTSPNGIATIINWQNTFSGLYAQAVTTASAGIFIIASA